ncbi:MAG: hypothetical protein PWQ67_2178 [Clostridia bacterium]|nr:hypothetical protein [Clostridia bacterium]
MKILKIFFKNPADYKVFEKWYYPILFRQGFSQRLFPRTGIFLEMQYPDWNGGVNSNKEHVNPNVTSQYDFRIFSRMVTKEEALAAGWTEKMYKNSLKHRISSLPHELGGHVVHLKLFGKDNSEIWQKVWKLMGRTDKPDFKPAKAGDYWYKPAYEIFANYMEDIIELRKENIPLMQYIWELLGIEILIFTLGSNIYYRNGVKKKMDRVLPNDNGRTFAPIRLLIDEFKDIKFRDVFFNWEHNEVILIGGNKDEFWEN